MTETTLKKKMAVSIPDPEKKGSIILLKELSSNEVADLILVIRKKINEISLIKGGDIKRRKAKKQALKASQNVLMNYFENNF